MKNKILLVGLLCSLLALTSCELFPNKNKVSSNSSSESPYVSSSETIPETDIVYDEADSRKAYSKIISLISEYKDYNADFSYNCEEYKECKNNVKKDGNLVTDSSIYQKYFNNDVIDKEYVDYSNNYQYSYNYVKNEITSRKKVTQNNNNHCVDSVEHYFIKDNILYSFNQYNVNNDYFPSFKTELVNDSIKNYIITPYNLQYDDNFNYSYPDTSLTYDEYLNKQFEKYNQYYFGQYETNNYNVTTYTCKSNELNKFTYRLSFNYNGIDFYYDNSCYYNDTNIVMFSFSSYYPKHYYVDGYEFTIFCRDKESIEFNDSTNNNISLTEEEMMNEKNHETSTIELHTYFDLINTNNGDLLDLYGYEQKVPNTSLADCIRDEYINAQSGSEILNLKELELQFYEDYECTIPYDLTKPCTLTYNKKVFVKSEIKEGYFFIAFDGESIYKNSSIKGERRIIELKKCSSIDSNIIWEDNYYQPLDVVCNNKHIKRDEIIEFKNKGQYVIKFIYGECY